MLIAVNKASLLKEVREALDNQQGVPYIKLTPLQFRAMYELSRSHPDEIVQFDPDGPLVRKRKSRAKQEQTETLPLKGTARVAVQGPVAVGAVLSITDEEHAEHMDHDDTDYDDKESDGGD